MTIRLFFYETMIIVNDINMHYNYLFPVKWNTYKNVFITPMNITPTSTTKDKPTKRSHSATQSWLKRDGFQCCLTSLQRIDEFAIEGAHNMPYALANEATCHNLDFWQMLDIFYSNEVTNMLFANFAGKQINSLANLISLNNSIHSIFDNHTLRLAPLTPPVWANPCFQ